MALVIISLIIYTALSISRNVDELGGEFEPSMLTQTLTSVARTSALAPMICMLFVACRMYVLATTEGLGEPPQWVKWCMYLTCGGMAGQVLLVFALPAFVTTAEEADYDMTMGAAARAAEEKERKNDSKSVRDQLFERGAAEDGEEKEANFAQLTGDYNDAHPDLSKLEIGSEGFGCAEVVFWTGVILCMLCIYCGAFGVVYGIFTFPGKTTKISVAVLCTILFSVIYLVVHLLLWIARSIPECPCQEVLLNASLAMSSVVRKSQMFAVLFLCSRMRALTLDPPFGMPPFWMQCCFQTVTGFLCLEVLAGAVVGATGNVTKAYYGVYKFHCESAIAHVVQHTSAFITYCALIPIAWGVVQMKHHEGIEAAPLSTTMHCILAFTAIYFSIMMSQTVTFFCEDVLGFDMPTLSNTVVAAGISVGMAPLLSILFVATRMRALQITQQQGAPQGWAQDCMNIAVFAVCIQAGCCLVMPIFIGKACKVDEDGNPDYDLKPMVGAYAVTVTKYVALFLLHGSVITICVATFIMTPETAHSGHRLINGGWALGKGTIVFCFIFLVALLLSSAKVIGLAVKFAVESCDRPLLGVDIELKEAALSLFRGYVKINHLVVKQPDQEIIYKRETTGELTANETGKSLEGHWNRDYIMKVDACIVKLNMWRLATSMGKEFELTNLTFTGIHANIEKPSTDMGSPDTNVEYILNHMEYKFMCKKLELDPEAAAAAKAEAEEKKKLDAEKAKLAAAAAAAAKLDAPPPEEGSGTHIIVHKISLGDVSCGVRVSKVPVIGTLSFEPSIGKITFEDVQEEVFHGKGLETMSGGEVVAGIVGAVSHRIMDEVVAELPKQLAGVMGAKVQSATQGIRRLGAALKSKLMCESRQSR
jgi:hypothetical protein